MGANPEQLHRDFQEAFNRHDLDAVCALYEPGAILVRPDGQAQGREAIRVAYREYFTASPIIELRTAAVHQCGNIALLQGEWTLRAASADGSEIHRRGRSLETVRLQADDRWLFAIDCPYGITALRAGDA
jgi:uncharacterized protein (TIGR02246 family)